MKELASQGSKQSNQLIENQGNYSQKLSSLSKGSLRPASIIDQANNNSNKNKVYNRPNAQLPGNFKDSLVPRSLIEQANDNSLLKNSSRNVDGNSIKFNDEIKNAKDNEVEENAIVLPEISTLLNFSVGAPSVKYTDSIINFCADVRYVQNRLLDIGLLSEKDYLAEYPKVEVNDDINNNDVTIQSPNKELSESEILMNSVYKRIGKGPQVSSATISKTIDAIKVFQREVKHGKNIDGRIDIGSTANLLATITRRQVIKLIVEYRSKKRQNEDKEKKKGGVAKDTTDELKKFDEDRIKHIKAISTDEQSVENIIDMHKNESDLACLLRDYSEHNPTLVIKVLEASDYSDQDDIVLDMLKITDDNLLSKLSSELLNKMKEQLEEGWTDKEENNEIKRLESKLNRNCESNNLDNNGFEKVFPLILENEGGWKDEPKKDKGDPTNKGISWPIWKKFANEDLGIAPTRENLRKLTDEQAKVIYLKRYWEPNGFALINDQELAFLIYDWTITSGGAINEIQLLLNNEFGQNIEADGDIGPQTIESINNVNNDLLFNRIKEVRIAYYKKGAENEWFSNDYLKGLLKRVNKFKNR